MAYVGVGETSALGYLPNDGHVFINVYARLKKSQNPELHIKTAHPHYLIQRFIDANTFKYERHIDNCFKVPRDGAKEFLGFVRPVNEQLEELDRRVKLLDETVSEDVDVANLDAFHNRMWKCHELIDQVGEVEHKLQLHKMILDHETDRRQAGIRGITRWKEYTSTRFSSKLAEKHTQQYQECHSEKVTGYLTLRHQPVAQPDHEIDLDREYSLNELRAQYRSFVDLLAQQKRFDDLLAVEKKHLKVAIGSSQSFQHLYSWSRKKVTSFNPPTFRALHPILYEACKVTSPPKWKCEILPFRG
jgi:hypothetical protein